jgi:hypothetical protein
MWFYRLKTYWTVSVVSDLEKEYKIEPKEEPKEAAQARSG